MKNNWANRRTLKRLAEVEKKLSADEPSKEQAKQIEQNCLNQLCESDLQIVMKAEEILTQLGTNDWQQLSHSDWQVVLKAEEILTQAELKESARIHQGFERVEKR